MRLASFNVQNMRLRADHLDGARDRDMPEDLGPAAPLLDDYDRALTAAVIGETGADIIALQEVFDQPTLDHFHDTCLRDAGIAPYPYRICLPGNDGRGLDVALLSRIAPQAIQSHAHLTPAHLGLDAPEGLSPETPLFRRDCLEITFPALTLFICHFKAPYPDAAATWPVRHLEALRRARPDPAPLRNPGHGKLADPRRSQPSRAAKNRPPQRRSPPVSPSTLLPACPQATAGAITTRWMISTPVPTRFSPPPRWPSASQRPAQS